MSEDIREEIARVIGENRSWAKRMEDGYMSVGSNTDEEIADALMPLVARIQAEAWDEGHVGDEHGNSQCECDNPYRADRQENPT